MIRTSDLKYKYSDSPLISFPDFEVRSGQALLICGESGCGKTTLLHLLAGLRRPNHGQIHIGENEISNLSSSEMDQFRGQHIGMVYQQSYFIESLSIKDNLLVSPYAQDKDKAKVVSNRLKISDLLSRHPNKLSVGQQQRANIARAVMNSPKLLLADEPTSALDNKNCSSVIDLLMEEAVANDAALIIVTHDDRLRADISDFVELSPITH